MLDLQKLKELQSKLTPGPWLVAVGKDGDHEVHDKYGHKLKTRYADYVLVDLANSLPEIIKELEAGRELVELVKGMTLKRPTKFIGGFLPHHEEAHSNGYERCRAKFVEWKVITLSRYNKQVNE